MEAASEKHSVGPFKGPASQLLSEKRAGAGRISSPEALFPDLVFLGLRGLPG